MNGQPGHAHLERQHRHHEDDTHDERHERPGPGLVRRHDVHIHLGEDLRAETTGDDLGGRTELGPAPQNGPEGNDHPRDDTHHEHRRRRPGGEARLLRDLQCLDLVWSVQAPVRAVEPVEHAGHDPGTGWDVHRAQDVRQYLRGTREVQIVGREPHLGANARDGERNYEVDDEEGKGVEHLHPGYY